MRAFKLFAAVSLYVVMASASAQLQVCNKTAKPIHFALHFIESSIWRTKGWYEFKPGECGNVTQTITNRYYYYYATRPDGTKWAGGSNDPVGCVRTTAFDIPDPCTGGNERVRLRSVEIEGAATSVILNFKLDSEPYQKVKVGEIHKRCLARWDDSHQVHSVRTIIDWNYQAVKTKMKKLEHCIELTVTGPVDIEDVARDFVQSCIDHGLNHQKTRHLLGLVAAIGADVLGAGGAATSAKVADYVSSAANETIDCLTDTDRISTYLGERLRDKFNATVKRRSHWVYWDL